MDQIPVVSHFIQDQERQHQSLSLPPIKLEVEAEAPREEEREQREAERTSKKDLQSLKAFVVLQFCRWKGTRIFFFFVDNVLFCSWCNNRLAQIADFQAINDKASQITALLKKSILLLAFEVVWVTKFQDVVDLTLIKRERKKRGRK